MKSLIVYSSRTGNTRAVAEAVKEAFPEPCTLAPVEEAPAVDDYDVIAIGYWVDKGMPDAKAKTFMEKIKGKKVGLFGTLGAYPDSEHANDCRAKAEALMEGNEMLGQFLCQGRVDPKVLEMMAKVASDQHPMTDERKARIEEAKKHPNEEDFEQAKAFFRKCLKG
ncbi:flavodoxin family protein [Desulfoluna spongiiphila]|uniref:Flavodoxin n=1 Tax=Desulfoluna spongiiphila TaxID=419481 RepID=A0A1G5H5D0_9BACT|nr:flavodoxin family protein [Desulfoluna spongiiphila]SCY58996.1 Flavodoxin [Desulfoluna spongiiphila]